MTRTVKDSGIGLKEEEIARLFTPFEQADSSTTRLYGGTGLGLTISKHLASLMGGDITVESQLGIGSTFKLKLPLQVSESPDSVKNNKVTDEKSTLSGLRVLAAEDVEMNRLILEDLLVHEGAIVEFAENGRQALDILQAEGTDYFDVVLMDVQMPVMDGLEAARHIRKMAANLPVIGLTAHTLEEEREKCRQAGMQEHVTKPVDPVSLKKAINNCVFSDKVLDAETV